jgi:hypothetical protein
LAESLRSAKWPLCNRLGQCSVPVQLALSGVRANVLNVGPELSDRGGAHETQFFVGNFGAAGGLGLNLTAEDGQSESNNDNQESAHTRRILLDDRRRLRSPYVSS